MRIEQLTFTRFVAAISIVIFHYGKEVSFFFNDYTDFIFSQANLGVSYFFVLSGFVMIVAYHKKVVFIDYLKKRIARIYPVYCLGILLMLIGYSLRFGKSDLFLNITLLQSWLPNKALTLNYPGWSLSVELFFYCCFPFLLNCFYRKQKLAYIFKWVVGFWLVSQVVFHLLIYKHIHLSFYGTKDILYHPIFHLNEFLIGNLAGLLFLKIFNKKKRNYTILIFINIALLLVILKFPIGLNYHNGLLSIIFAPLIILLSLTTGRFKKIMSKDIFVFLGEISFGIYILQAPVWTILSDHRLIKYFGMTQEMDETLFFFIRLMFLILLASISYIYFEKPMRNKIRQLRIKKLFI